jgi:hypothetical protein
MRPHEKNLRPHPFAALLRLEEQPRRRTAMKRTLIRYRVKPEKAAENQALIEKVFEQLRRESPPAVRYASFKLEDGVTFVHLVTVEDDSDPIPKLEAFRGFTEGLRARCDEPPVFHALDVVGSYRVFEP